MIIQRIGINTNKLIKTYQIGDGNNDNNKVKIYNCHETGKMKYMIVFVH